MKLLYCSLCEDIRALQLDSIVVCRCGKTSGRYTDNVNAEYIGAGYLLGISNASFALATRRYRADSTQNVPFEAFTIPSNAASARRVPFISEPPATPTPNSKVKPNAIHFYTRHKSSADRQRSKP